MERRHRGLWPEGCLRAEPLERRPVLAHGREDVQHDRASGAGVHLVRDVGWDAPGAAGYEVACLVVDAERHGSAKHHPELLVVVAVLGNDAQGLELDDCKAAALALDRACNDAVPDAERLQRGKISERTHDPEASGRAGVTAQRPAAAELP